MEAGMQMVLPILGIVAAAAATFYAVSFAEIREVSFHSMCAAFICCYSLYFVCNLFIQFYILFFFSSRNLSGTWKSQNMKMVEGSSHL